MDDAPTVQGLVHEEFDMGFASHLGPWRLGTVTDTTGTTAGTISNMGCTVVAQSGAITKATTTAANVAVLESRLTILIPVIGSVLADKYTV